MRKKTTKISIQLSDPSTTKELLVSLFPEHQIKYFVFGDRWVIKNKKLKHSIWYNAYKASKLTTEFTKQLKEVTLLNLASGFLLLSFWLLNEQNEWIENTSSLFFIWVGLTSFFNYLVLSIKPNYKHSFEEEHQQVLAILQSNFSQ